jgi:hypothetical protein
LLRSTFWLQPDAPLPLGAAYAPLTQRLTVTWDRQLASTNLDPANWSMRYNGANYTFGGAWTAATQTIAAPSIPGSPNPGPNVCHYTPPPYDVLSHRGGVAAAFADLPVI